MHTKQDLTQVIHIITYFMYSTPSHIHKLSYYFQIEQFAMIPAKETKEMLYNMFSQHFVSITVSLFV